MINVHVANMHFNLNLGMMFRTHCLHGDMWITIAWYHTPKVNLVRPGQQNDIAPAGNSMLLRFDVILAHEEYAELA